MTLASMQSLLPLIVLAVTAVVTMLVVGYHRNLALTAIISLAGLAIAFSSLPLAAAAGTSPATLLTVDAFTIFYEGLIFATAFIVVMIAYGYMRQRPGEREEFFILLLLATLGAAVLVTSSHFVSFFLGLEILSVSLYALIAYARLRSWTVEAGMKYLVLASASAALLLLGMAFVYTELGTMELGRIAVALTSPGPDVNKQLLLAGTVLVVTGIGFKLAVVPFHMWTPDIYEGAPAPVTAFVATISKGAMVGLLLRFLGESIDQEDALFVVFSVIAIASMIGGNLLALLQSNVKRMLAYSSIAHLGYVLVAFLAGGAAARLSVTFYLVAYFVTTLGAFGVISALSPVERDADDIESYRGLAWRHPLLAAVLVTTLLSLAGIPLTAGFIGKLYVALAGVGTGMTVHVLVLVLGSAIGLFYYLRLILAVFAAPPADRSEVPAPGSTWATSIALAILTLLLVVLGTYPAPMIELIMSIASPIG